MWREEQTEQEDDADHKYRQHQQRPARKLVFRTRHFDAFNSSTANAVAGTDRLLGAKYPAMSLIQKHLRNTFLTGIFAAIPLAVTVFVVIYIEGVTRQPLRQATGIDIPFVGVLVAVAAIYLLGLIVNSLLGRLLLRSIDRVLSHLPFLKDLYQAWKQVTLTPGGKEGMYAKVVLISPDGEHTCMLGFTSGDPLPGDALSCCVFVPNAPNPVTGRLYFVRREHCRMLDITANDAFKLLLSNGNYVPPQVIGA